MLGPLWKPPPGARDPPPPGAWYPPPPGACIPPPPPDPCMWPWATAKPQLASSATPAPTGITILRMFVTPSHKCLCTCNVSARELFRVHSSLCCRPHQAMSKALRAQRQIGLVVLTRGSTIFNRLNGALDLGMIAVRNLLQAGYRPMHAIVEDNPAIGASRFLVCDCVLSTKEYGSRLLRYRKGTMLAAKASGCAGCHFVSRRISVAARKCQACEDR